MKEITLTIQERYQQDFIRSLYNYDKYIYMIEFSDNEAEIFKQVTIKFQQTINDKNLPQIIFEIGQTMQFKIDAKTPY